MSEYLRYFGYFGWLVFLYMIARERVVNVTKKERINNLLVTRYNWLFTILLIIPLIYLTAVRSKGFGDTGVYWNTFESMPSSFSKLPSYIGTLSKDKWFYIMAAFIRCCIGFRPVVYFGIIAIIQLFLMSSMLRRYSYSLILSFFIFVASTDYLSYMHNGVRQFTAVAIILAGSRFVFEKKYIPALLTVLIASQFHQSALIMLPVIFIVQGKPWNKSTVMILALSFLAIIYVNRFTSILEGLLTDTNYTNVVSDWQSWSDDGTNPLRVLVYSVPALLSLIGIRQIREADDPIINVCTNMSVITAGLYMISMVTSGIFIGRLPIYVSVYSNCILLPWEIEHIFNTSSSKIIRTAMVVCYLLFYYYQIHFAWGAI